MRDADRDSLLSLDCSMLADLKYLDVFIRSSYLCISCILTTQDFPILGHHFQPFRNSIRTPLMTDRVTDAVFTGLRLWSLRLSRWNCRYTEGILEAIN